MHHAARRPVPVVRAPAISAAAGAATLPLLALLAETVYLVATLRLPWPRYGGELTSWSQILAPPPGSQGPSPFLVALISATLLLALYLVGWYIVRTHGAPRKGIWAGMILFAVTLFWLLPITSDLFGYLRHAHQLTDLDMNPLEEAVPLDSGDRLLDAYPVPYAGSTSIYGPAWLWLSAGATALGDSIAQALAYLKGLVLVGFLLCGWLLERILRDLRPERSVEGLYLFGWNPLVLWMAVGDGHNDIWMMALVLVAVRLLLRRQWATSATAIALSAGIKVVSLALMPLMALLALTTAAPEARPAERLPGRPLARAKTSILVRGLVAVAFVGLLLVYPAGGFDYVAAEAERLLHPDNWQSEMVAVAAPALAIGLVLFALAYALILLHLLQSGLTRDRVLHSIFLVSLLAFVLGGARAQPWHLIWPAALAGLSARRWAWPATIGLSAVALLGQIWVEWGAPGLGAIL